MLFRLFFLLLFHCFFFSPLVAQFDSYEEDTDYAGEEDGYDQDENELALHPLHSIQITLPSGLSYSYEHPLGKKFLLYVEPRFYATQLFTLGTHPNVYVLGGGIALGFRYYYNRQKRKEQGRSIKLNSGNFIAVFAEHISFAALPPSPRHLSGQIFFNVASVPGIAWGMKRSLLRSKFFLDGFLGMGYVIENPSIALDAARDVYHLFPASNKYSFPFTLFFQFRIGYTF